MPFDQRNLANTVYARGVAKHRAPCKVGWAIDAYANGGRTWTWCHQWDGERCKHCHKTLAEIMVSIPPPEPEPGSAAHLDRALYSGL